MATRTTPFDPGTPCWTDLQSSDVDRAKSFYSQLFSWTADDLGEGQNRYVTFRSDGHAVAGLMGRPEHHDGPEVWRTYLSTDDVDATVAEADRAGATVVVPRMEVGEAASIGVFAVVIDPSGAAVALWQAGAHVGFEKYNDPGSVTWDELTTKDFAAAIDFYTKVFGWGIQKMSDTDEFRYYTGTVQGNVVAGVMDAAKLLPAETPSSWGVYFRVEGVDAAAARAVELGATVTRDAADSPFGRMALIADPAGAAFTLHGPNIADPRPADA